MESSTISVAGFMITRLNGQNYATWSKKVRMLLKHQSLWKVVADPPDLDNLDEDEDAEVIEQFHKENEKAMCLIGLSLEDQLLVHIDGIDSAKECWDALRTIYVQDSVGVQIYLMQKLLSACLQPKPIREKAAVECAAESTETAKAYTVKRCFRGGSPKHLLRDCHIRKGKKTQNPGNPEVTNLTVTGTSRGYDNCYAVDSGATANICKSKKLFKSLVPVQNQCVKLADGISAAITGKGSVFLSGLNRSFEMVCVPSLKYNLLSVTALTKEGCSCTFTASECRIKGNDGKSAIAKLQGDLYLLGPVGSVGKVGSVCTNKLPHDNCIHLLHHLLGRPCFQALKKTVEQSEGVKLKPCLSSLLRHLNSHRIQLSVNNLTKFMLMNHLHTLSLRGQGCSCSERTM